MEFTPAAAPAAGGNTGAAPRAPGACYSCEYSSPTFSYHLELHLLRFFYSASLTAAHMV